MQLLKDSMRLLGTLVVLAAALLTTGCLDRTPDQSGVFVSGNAGDSWKAVPDLQAKGTHPDTFPPLKATAVAAAPSNPDRVFAGTEDDLYVSSDGGKGWTRLTDRLPDAGAIDVQDIAVLTSDPNVALVAGVSNGYGKVFRTVDGGKHFSAVFTGSGPKRSVNAVAFGSGLTVFAGDQDGNVFRSTNRGDSWQRVFTTESPVSTIATSGPHLFVGTFERGVFHSADAGGTFAAGNAGLSGRSLTIWSLATGNGKLYAGTQQGLFQSGDFGRSWRQLNDPDATQGTIIQNVAVGGGTVYFASNAVVYRLTDGGTHFVPRQINLVHSVTDIAPVSATRVYLSASSQDVENAGSSRNGLPILQGVAVPGG